MVSCADSDRQCECQSLPPKWSRMSFAASMLATRRPSGKGKCHSMQNSLFPTRLLCSAWDHLGQSRNQLSLQFGMEPHHADLVPRSCQCLAASTSGHFSEIERHREETRILLSRFCRPTSPFTVQGWPSRSFCSDQQKRLEYVTLTQPGRLRARCRADARGDLCSSGFPVICKMFLFSEKIGLVKIQSL